MVWLQPKLTIFNRPLPPPPTMASATCNSPEPEVYSFSMPIIAHLTVHSTSPGKKKAPKKAVKTKEFVHMFCTTKSNYLEFLTTILTKHHSNKFQVMDHRCYTCKIQVLPSKYIVHFI